MVPVRRWLWSGLCMLALTGAGCNVLSLPFFIFGPEPKLPPLLHRIAPEDSKQEVKAVILVASSLEIRPELIRADRDLGVFLTKHLRQACDYNGEKVKVVSPTQVDNFKSEHPDWRKWEPAEIGKHFGADWVIYLEVSALSLYEKGSNNQLYRGRAEIGVSLIDVRRPEEGFWQKPFSGQYPGEARPPVDAAESNPMDFRRTFLDHVAEQIAWYFTSHPTSKEFHCR